MTIGEGGHKRGLIDETAAGGVDQDRAAFHAPDAGGVDEAGGLGHER